MPDYTLRNLRALARGTPRFFFSKGATSVADALSKGYREMGNLKDAKFKLEREYLEHKGCYSGKLRIDRRDIQSEALKITMTVEELGAANMAVLLGATTGTAFTQAAITTQAGDAWAFNTVNAVAGVWYQVLKSAVAVRELTAITIPAKVEGTDFFVDYKLGLVRFAATQSASLTPTISASAVTAGGDANLKQLVPMNDVQQSGYGRLCIYDTGHPNQLIQDWGGFSCQLGADAELNFDGTAFAGFDLTATIMDIPGTFWVAEA